MLCTWQIRATANNQADPQRARNANNIKPILECGCEFLRAGYIRVLLPETVTTWRLDLVFGASTDAQNVVLLADSASATPVDEPLVVTVTQWWADRPFPGRPLSNNLDAGSLRLIVSPLPAADWAATVDLDIYSPNPSIEPCR